MSNDDDTTKNESKSVDSGPEDRKKFVYIVFYWLGIGTLLPWNFFITVNDYWNYKLRTVENITSELDDDGSEVVVPPSKNEMQTVWSSRMAVASMVPNVTLLLLNAVFGHRFKTQPRLLVSLVLIIALFGVTSALALVNSDDWQFEFLVITLVSVVLININGAIFQGGLLGVAGRFPPMYMGGVFAGQALGGIFASVTNVVMFALGADPVWGAFFCFLVAVLFLFSALICYLAVAKTEFYQFYLGERKDVNLEIEESKKEASKLLEAGVPDIEIENRVNFITIFGTISLYAVSIYLLFAVTLACFPALTCLIVSVHPGSGAWSDVYFVPVVCFVLFNVGDYVGRFIAEHLQWPKPGKIGMIVVFTLTLCRIAFIPLFLFCNANPLNRSNTYVFFDSDLAYILFMALFSVSGGYLANMCMMSAPQICKPTEQSTAASLMVALLGLGLGTGALLSNFVVQAL